MKNLIKLYNYNIIDGYALTHASLHKIEYLPRESDALNGGITVWLKQGYLDEGSSLASYNGFVTIKSNSLKNMGISSYLIPGEEFEKILTNTSEGDVLISVSKVLNYLIKEGYISGELI